MSSGVPNPCVWLGSGAAQGAKHESTEKRTRHTCKFYIQMIFDILVSYLTHKRIKPVYSFDFVQVDTIVARG